MDKAGLEIESVNLAVECVGSMAFGKQDGKRVALTDKKTV